MEVSLFFFIVFIGSTTQFNLIVTAINRQVKQGGVFLQRVLRGLGLLLAIIILNLDQGHLIRLMMFFYSIRAFR